MKIGMLSQWYDPEPGPAALPGIYGREFIQQGHQVKVLTGFPNYPDGNLYPGFKMKPRAQETNGSIGVTRVALYPDHSSSALGRVANYSSFGLSAATLGMGALRDIDALWVYNSPVTVALPMLAHNRFGKIPTFLHVQDLWPDSLIESGMFPGGAIGSAAESIVGKIVRLMERRSTVIGVISESVRNIILDRNPRIDPRKIVYVPNPTKEELFRPVEETRTRQSITRKAGDPVEIMYAGAVGEVQGLDVLLEAATLLRSRTDIKFTIVGDGISRKRLEEKAKSLNLPSINFTGRLPQEQIPTLIASADIQLVSLSSQPFLAHTTPSKIPSLLASGVPIVAQLEGDGAKLLKESGAAVVSKPGDPVSLANAIEAMANGGPEHWRMMGNSGHQYYRTRLSASAAAKKITDSLEGITA